MTQRGGALVLSDTLLTANVAEGGLGLGIGSPQGQPGGTAYGGGLYLLAGAAQIVGSTLALNRCVGGAQLGGGGPGWAFGGGIFNLANLAVLNSTVFANEAQAGTGRPPEGSGFGGGFFNDSGVLVLRYTTLANNSARNTPGISFLGIEGGESGGGIYSGTNGLVTLVNTIVANSPVGSNAFGALVDGGHNLSSDASCNFSAPGSLNNTDPKLGPLADYGGATPTMALLASSPAIDAASAGTATDQRGRPRPFGAAADIGAFESSAPYTVLGRLNGYVPPAGTASVEDASVSAQIDAFGNYALHGLTAGAHTLKPQSALALFVPKTRRVDLTADLPGIDFTSYRTNAITISRLGYGAVSAIYAGEPGVSYNVHLSTALPAWSQYSNVAADAEGLVHWSETNSNGGTTRFFRVERP